MFSWQTREITAIAVEEYSLALDNKSEEYLSIDGSLKSLAVVLSISLGFLIKLTGSHHDL